MNQHFLTCVLLLVSATLTLAGCVSSEETGSGSRAKSPVQIFGPIDTTRHVVHQDTISKLRIDSVKTAPVKKPQVAPKFRSQQDTVRASVVTRSKSSLHPLINNIHPEHQMFTVQIGAFNRVSNALQTQKKAKEYFAYQPVLNTFVKHSKLYRVTIGKYENRKDAFALCDSLKRKDPNEYKHCQVSSIP